ncbi:MAG: zinc-binding alcohol dehydrogenase family protein [Phenylobacterium sp.]
MSSDAPAVSAAAAARHAVSLRLPGKFETLEDLRFDLVTGPIAPGAPGDAIVEVHAAAVNPSDVKAALGMMPYAVFPRTPGRDFAGVVVDGPAELVGTAVFGSSGDLGIRRDGAHATHVSVAPAALVTKPPGLSMDEAAGLGVPFVTAIEGFRRAGMPAPGDTVLIFGLSGRVGQAAAQVALWLGARVIGVSRRPTVFEPLGGAQVELIDSSREDTLARVRDLTHGHGADIVFNTVGEPYYQLGVEAAALKGRLIFIASFREPSAFDIFVFYRRQHTYVGVDTLALSSEESGARLRELLPGFSAGRLAPFAAEPNAIYALEDAAAAFRAVMEPSSPRIILRPRR